MYHFPAMLALFNIDAPEDEDLGRCEVDRMLNSRLGLGISSYLSAYRKGRQGYQR